MERAQTAGRARERLVLEPFPLLSTQEFLNVRRIFRLLDDPRSEPAVTGLCTAPLTDERGPNTSNLFGFFWVLTSLFPSSATFGEAGRPGRVRPEQGAPAAPVREMQSPGLLLPPRAIGALRRRRRRHRRRSVLSLATS